MAAQDDEGECEPLVLASRDSDAVALSRMEDSPSSPDDGGGNPDRSTDGTFVSRARTTDSLADRLSWGWHEPGTQSTQDAARIAVPAGNSPFITRAGTI